eukprot:3292310-Rhodomonas_salina.1
MFGVEDYPNVRRQRSAEGRELAELRVLPLLAEEWRVCRASQGHASWQYRRASDSSSQGVRQGTRLSDRHGGGGCRFGDS